tara:strand:- start:129 stop:887 length:759 start_codon:yes stop_codon:yes gene_type:complete
VNIIVVNNWITQSAAVAPTDPNFADVVLLLHMDGANGGTSFSDSSNSAHTATAVGNANTSTAIPKFGTASYQGDGSGDYLSFPDSADFDIGLPVGYSNEPFTVEFFANLNSTGGTQMFFGKGGGTAGWNSTSGFQYIYFIQSGVLYFQFWQSGFSPNTISANISTLGLSTGNWYHFAIAYNGTTTEAYFNGSRYGTSTAGYGSPSAATSFRVGGATPSYSMNGYIDEFRITKGSSRYTGTTLTVPTAAFPNS